MKTFSLFLILIFVASIASSQWFVQEAEWRGANLRSVCFTDANNGYAVGLDGEILKTTNGGVNWELKYTATASLNSVYFTSTDTGYVVGSYGTILKTVNAGIDWFMQYTNNNTTQTFTSICFSEANEGYLVGYGDLFKLYNGSNVWTKIDIFFNFPYYSSSVYFIDTNTGYVVGNQGGIYKTTDGGATWEAKTSGISNTLHSVYFIDSNIGFVVGSSGKILKTTDGGANWSVQTSGTTNTLNAINFIDSNTGYAVGSGGTILKTVNGGTDWIIQNSGTNNYLYSVDFADSSTCYTVGVAQTILKTNNGDFNWTSLTSGLAYDLRSIFFANTSVGYAVGYNGTILKTINAGISWDTLSSGTINTLSSVYFTDENIGFSVGTLGTIIKTIDGGMSWFPLASNVTNSLTSIYFIDSNIGYATGSNGNIIKTINGGNDWSNINSTTSSNWNSVYFINENTGYVFGYDYNNNRTILKTTDGGINWVVKNPYTGYALQSVYFTNANTGYAVGSSGTILKTINAGENWNSVSSGTTNTLTSVFFTSTDTGYAVGYFGTILRTTDAGTTWASQISPAIIRLNDIYFTSSSNGYIVGNGRTILKTSNGGQTPALITLEPNNLTKCIGSSSQFQVSAIGSETINYKWQHNGVDIANSNSATLNLSYTTHSDSGSYRCIAWNAVGADTSTTVYLKVVELTLNAGSDKYICNGNYTVLNATVSSNHVSESGNYSYNWYPQNGLSSVNVSNPTAFPVNSTMYYVTVTDQLGCTKTDNIYINVGNVFQNENICLVSVDTALTKNKVLWIKTPNVGTTSYNIYKETSLNNYSLLGSSDFSQPSVYVDNSSQPESHGDKYKISVVDTCGNESELSPFHKTLNLTVAVNGTTMGLNWDDYVDESGDFIPSMFYILKGTSSSNMVIFDSISASFHSYNDYNVTQSYYYMVGVKKNSSCNTNKSANSFSFSNKKQNFSSGIDELANHDKINICPNPFSEKTLIEFENINSEKCNIIMKDILGKDVRIYNTNSTKLDIEKGDLSKGIYIIEIKGKSINSKGKLIIE